MFGRRCFQRSKDSNRDRQKKMLRIILAKKDVENYFGRREKNLERTYSRKDG
jgi:hypothetical protein